MLSIDEYLKLRERPNEPRIMFQNWRDLLFAHFDCDPDELRPLLPNGLEIDTFDGRAFVGLIPFRVEKLRPPYLPPLPRVSFFPEANVRTYVHRNGENPGIWFFSLDAASWLACRFANWTMKLPYKHARMKMEGDSGKFHYRSNRNDDPKPADLKASWTFGDKMGPAKPGSLDFFLVERYVLFSASKGELYRCQVHHPPYELVRIEERKIETSLITAAGIHPRPWNHFVGCKGMDVEVFPLKRA